MTPNKGDWWHSKGNPALLGLVAVAEAMNKQGVKGWWFLNVLEQ